jgi:hypothetical protein
LAASQEGLSSMSDDEGSVLSVTLYSIYTNDTPKTHGVFLSLFANDSCLYARDRKQQKLQRGHCVIETWCERWNIKINEEQIQAIYSSPRLRPPEARHILNGRNIPFVNHVKYPGVILDKWITWRLHIELTEANTFRTFIRIYSLFKVSI